MALLERAGIAAPPVDLDKLGEVQQVRSVEEAKMGPILGCTQRQGRGFAIKLNSDYPLKRRFTYAHEIAHTILQPIPKNSAGSEKISYRTQRVDGDLERLCDQLAAEMLMPRDWLRPMVIARPVLLKTIVNLAALYETSLESLAVRYSQLAPHAVRVICWRAEQERLRLRWIGGQRPMSLPITDKGLVRPLEEASVPQHAYACRHRVVWQGRHTRSSASFYAEARGFGSGSTRYVLGILKGGISENGFRFLESIEQRRCSRINPEPSEEEGSPRTWSA